MILVTGGTGLVGSHLLYRLCQDRIPVRAISRNTSRSERVKRLFVFYDPEHGAEKFQQIEWLDGDILDIVSLEDAMKSVKKVYLEKICHVSSTAALGANSGETVTEELKWKQSPETSGYSLSKYSAEKEIWRGVEEGLNAVIVNPSVVFGSGFWDESSLAIFRTVNNGLHFYTSGSNAFVDGRDLAEIMVRLMESDAKNERFLCTGTNVTFRKMTTMIADQLGKKVPSISAPKWFMGLVWRLSWVSAKLRNQDPVITKASARTAFTNTIYDPEHGAEKFQQIEWLDGDILDIVSLEDAMKSVKKVYLFFQFVALLFYPGPRQKDLKIQLYYFPRYLLFHGNDC